MRRNCLKEAHQRNIAVADIVRYLSGLQWLLAEFEQAISEIKAAITIPTNLKHNYNTSSPYVSKAVYCIDNVSTTVGVDIMQAFIGQNGVTVLSCHSVKPRRSWWQREAGVFPKGRNTFRVCIPREQRDKLLKPDIWPSHITITPWIFTKKRAQTQETDVDRRTSQSDHDVGPTAAGTNQQGSTAVTSLLPTVDNNRTANNDAEGTDRDMESETTITDYYNDDA